MTGDEFKAIRLDLECSEGLFGLLLGYRGNLDTINRQVRDYEARDEVPEHIARLAWLLGEHGAPEEWWNKAQADLDRLNAERAAVRQVRHGGGVKPQQGATVEKRNRFEKW